MKTAILAWIIILLLLGGSDTSLSEAIESSLDAVGRGKELVGLLGCEACHSLNGQEGKKGPSLGRIGRSLSIQAIQEQLQTPRRRYPASQMPSFAFVRPVDFQPLLDYLASLK